MELTYAWIAWFCVITIVLLIFSVAAIFIMVVGSVSTGMKSGEFQVFVGLVLLAVYLSLALYVGSTLDNINKAPSRNKVPVVVTNAVVTTNWVEAAK